jgi:hypothetical protein
LAENLARRGTQKSLSVTEAKAKVIELIQQGFKVEQACAVVGRSAETYRDWRKNDPQFKAAIDSIRAVAQSQRQNGKLEVPDFETFCRDYLKQPLYQHQLRMHDVIDGREPRNMHFSFTYEAGYEDRVLINVPPEHAKSTTFTVNWVVWNIVKNPDIRIVLVSKGLRLAENFLYEIKLKLTSPLYREMQMAFGPEGGFQDPDNAWTADRIYVKGKNENIEAGVQKDPTVQAMGSEGDDLRPARRHHHPRRHHRRRQRSRGRDPAPEDQPRHLVPAPGWRSPSLPRHPCGANGHLPRPVRDRRRRRQARLDVLPDAGGHGLRERRLPTPGRRSGPGG